MKKLVISIMITLLFINSGCAKSTKINDKTLINKNTISNGKVQLHDSKYKNDTVDSYVEIMKQDILCLMMAYPEYIEDVEKASNGTVYIKMKSGKKIIYDDKKQKSFEQKLANPDIEDMMQQIYPLETTLKLSEKNFDPGRSRVYDLLNEVYGGSRQKVESNLINVDIGQGSCQFNRSSKAAVSLKASMKELRAMSVNRRDIRICLYPASGTYNYRVISGTNRLSPHSYGIAIDLARDKRDYWQWASREDGQKRLSSYSKDVVQIFEKNNFIWGGKWGHFDILHFEYRPEIILKARYFAEKRDPLKPWYYGAPQGEEYVKDCIDKIDKNLN